ncbi:starvation-inducible protein [Photobacterium sp. GB-27]|uniref:Slp family lipoprotein n=1 Tax=unclassified Photobacterium TaxID=2628852 RepID=UPI000D153465|nr:MULTISPECIES: Slp family lipoprotein [unclassified Photobacterium]PSV39468.1 starvation-inducible protein [Photobacterium sp. GB-27]PSV46429.1 starvation-inducible protein [Photobacterium sp. GB-36]
MFRTLFLGLILIFMVGCASVPASLQTKTKNPITDLRVITEHPTVMQHQEVRLGGIIASIKNEAKQTRVEIVALPLTSDGRPILNSKPQGRFIANVPGFLDPIEYAKGRLLTVVGQYTEMQKGKVGEYDYTFPVVNASGEQIWQVQQQIQMETPMRFNRCIGINCGFWGDDYFMSPFGIQGRVVDRVIM